MDLIGEIVDSKDLEEESIETCLLGLPPIAPYHIGYDLFAASIRHLEDKGIQTEILYPRMHFEDLPDLESRMDYYSTILGEFSNITPEFNYGDFQFKPSYQKELIRISKQISSSRIPHALPSGKEKIFDCMLVASQILDPVYLDKDMVLSGMPQRRVYMLGREILDEDEKRPIVFLELAKDVNGNRLKNSTLDTRVNIHDSKKAVRSKIQKMSEEILQQTFKYSVEPYYEDPGSLTGENVSNKLIQRFEEIEKTLRKGNNMNWINRDKFQ